MAPSLKACCPCVVVTLLWWTAVCTLVSCGSCLNTATYSNRWTVRGSSCRNIRGMTESRHEIKALLSSAFLKKEEIQPISCAVIDVFALAAEGLTLKTILYCNLSFLHSITLSFTARSTICRTLKNKKSDKFEAWHYVAETFFGIFYCDSIFGTYGKQNHVSPSLIN